MFPNTLGRPLRAENFQHLYFYPLLKKAGLPTIRFYETPPLELVTH